MTDNKLTDNEIIKALECCGTGDFCNHCKYQDLRYCYRHLAKDVLNLFDRLQAENERLNKALIEQKLKNNMLYETAKEIEAEAYKEFAERLKKEYSLNWLVSTEDIDNLLKELVGEDK